MIYVVFYVTGLALVQLPGGCTPALHLFMPGGNYYSTSVKNAHIHDHTLDASVVAHTGTPQLLSATDMTLTAAGTGCQSALPTVPDTLPVIDSLIRGQVTVKKDCCDYTSACEPTKHKSALRLKLNGDWTIEAAKACPRSTEQLPRTPDAQEKGFFGQAFNFLDATRPWNVLFSAVDELQHYGNTIVLTGKVQPADMKTFLGSQANLDKATLPANTCNWLLGRSIGGLKSCVIVRISNQPKKSETAPLEVGAADNHFAAYYDFLDVPSGTNFYLPILAGGNMCPDLGGAGHPTGSCLGGIVAQPCTR